MIYFHYRTEDIAPGRVLEFFVQTEHDEETILQLRDGGRILLEGSRGTGKSFLLRVAEQRMLSEFSEQRVLPVYVSFMASSLLRTSDSRQFHNWMLAKIAVKLLRAVRRQGLTAATGTQLSIFPGERIDVAAEERLYKLVCEYETSYRTPESPAPDASKVPSVEMFREFVEDACEAWKIERVVFLIDEAAHVFRPAQQRQFFTLFRDLRSHLIACKAAVYPGVTSYGETFQPRHDAKTILINRDIHSDEYVSVMREIVERQADETLRQSIERNAENFALLAYSVTGNPRLMLKTVGAARRLNSTEVNAVLKDYFRTDIWSEHSALSSSHEGHKELVDWGRTFLEETVIVDLKARNDASRIRNGSSKVREETTCYFWVDRDAPQLVFEALRLLAYTGIVVEEAQNFKGTRGRLGFRYAVNVGCLLAAEGKPATDGFSICKALTKRRFAEYGATHQALASASALAMPDAELVEEEAFQQRLASSIEVLDLSTWQKEKLPTIGIRTLQQLLTATEEDLQKIKWVGEKRSRRILNTAVAAVSVLEYLSG